MKICLFGGTFDPPHVGHLIIGEMVKESENFDRIIFIPAFIPPHKETSSLSPIEDRWEMLRLVLNQDENFELSDVEIKRGGLSYAIETIRELKSRHDLKKDRVYFLMGSDSLLEFHIWKDYEAILNECQVLVAVRPGFDPDHVSPSIISQVRIADIPQIDISSSEIRDRIRRGLTIRYMVLDPVREYITEKGFYK